MRTREEVEAAFPVGSRVVVKEGKWPMAAKPGATATVRGYEEIWGEGKWGIMLVWDHNSLWYNQMDGEYYPESFELSKPLTPFEISVQAYIDEAKRELGI